jgi:hypothetical protein
VAGSTIDPGCEEAAFVTGADIAGNGGQCME